MTAPAPGSTDRAVRVATATDAAAVAAIYRSAVEDGHASFEAVAPGEDDMRNRMSAVLARYPWLVAESANDIDGYAYASPHRDRAAYRWSADVTVYVAASRQGQGVGRALYSRLLPILEAQGLHRAYAGIALPNAGSVRLHEACGFVHIGVYEEVGFKHGAWRDVGWWGRPLAAAAHQPAEPIWFPDLPRVGVVAHVFRAD